MGFFSRLLGRSKGNEAEASVEAEAITQVDPLEREDTLEIERPQRPKAKAARAEDRKSANATAPAKAREEAKRNGRAKKDAAEVRGTTSSPFLPGFEGASIETAEPPSKPRSASSPFLAGVTTDGAEALAAAGALGEKTSVGAVGSAPRITAKRAEAPVPALPAEGDSADVAVDEWAAEFEKSFDGLVLDDDPGASPAEVRENEFDRSSVLELFSQIATNYLRPVRSFMLELKAGEVRREWIDIARPAVKSILEAAKQIGVPDLETGLGDFEAALDEAEQTPGATIAGDGRDMLLEAYESMAERLPQVFALDQDLQQRESMIIHALLLQVPEVRKVTVDKIYRAGLTSLDVLFLASTEDLAATTGIRIALAERIVDRFRHYKKELESSVPDAEQSAARAKLADLTSRLKDETRRYDEASAARNSAEKRSVRIARESTLLEITVALAELGAYDLVEKLERVSFSQKLTELESYLENAS